MVGMAQGAPWVSPWGRVRSGVVGCLVDLEGLPKALLQLSSIKGAFCTLCVQPIGNMFEHEYYSNYASCDFQTPIILVCTLEAT